MNKTIVFIDSEIDSDGKIADIGAVYEGAEFHGASSAERYAITRILKYLFGNAP